MGLPKFLNIKKGKKNKDSDSSNNVPLPPQKPSKGDSNTPLSQSIPPPPKPGAPPSMPDIPSPEGYAPTPETADQEPAIPDMPKPESPAMSETSMPDIPSPDTQNSIPEMPAAPELQPQFKPTLHDMPPPEDQMLQEPTSFEAPNEDRDEKFDLPGFDEPLPEETPQESSDLDWTQDGHEDTVSLDQTYDLNQPESSEDTVSIEDEPVQEFSFADPNPVEETPAESEESEETISWHEEAEEQPVEQQAEPKQDLTEEPIVEAPAAKPEVHIPAPTPETERIHTEEGELFVKAEHFQELFGAIKEIRTDVNKLEESLNSFATTSKEQENHYEKIAGAMNEVQQNLLTVDTKVFERV